MALCTASGHSSQESGLRSPPACQSLYLPRWRDKGSCRLTYSANNNIDNDLWSTRAGKLAGTCWAKARGGVVTMAGKALVKAAHWAISRQKARKLVN